MNNFLHDVRVLIDKVRKEGKNNLFSSVYFGMRAAGAQDMINRLPYLKDREFLSALKLRKYIGEDYYTKAEASFLKSPEGIAPASAEEKLKIVLAIGLYRMYQLFDDSYFASRGERGIDHINEIFWLATPDQRSMSLARGLLQYFGQSSSKEHWTEDNADILEFLAGILVGSLGIYGPVVDKDLATYLVDTYGLEIAFNMTSGFSNGQPIYDDENFADVIGYASTDGFSAFLADNAENHSIIRMTNIEMLLFLRNNMDALTNMVGTIGCKNYRVERHLLFQSMLPIGSVRKGLCFPQNLEELINQFGANDVSAAFPEAYKRSHTNLWEWVKTGLKPAKIAETMTDVERNYLLASATLCRQYMAEGGKFSRKDIAKLLEYGQDEIIAEYRK